MTFFFFFFKEFNEQMRRVEEEARLERERLDKERLLAIKNKEKREQSAVASSEVKQKLQVKKKKNKFPISTVHLPHFLFPPGSLFIDQK